MHHRFLALVVLLTCSLCEVIVFLPAYNYNYTTSNLLNVTDKDDWAFEVNLPFSIRFQGTSYSKFYVCTNSYITFGGPSTAYTNLDKVPYPKLFIDAADNVATNLTVSVASNNVTIYYLGRRYR